MFHKKHEVAAWPDTDTFSNELKGGNPRCPPPIEKLVNLGKPSARG